MNKNNELKHIKYNKVFLATVGMLLGTMLQSPVIMAQVPTGPVSVDAGQIVGQAANMVGGAMNAAGVNDFDLAYSFNGINIKMSVNLQVSNKTDPNFPEMVTFNIQNDGIIPILPQITIYSIDEPNIPLASPSFNNGQIQGLPPLLMPGMWTSATWLADENMTGTPTTYIVKVADITGVVWHREEFTINPAGVQNQSSNQSSLQAILDQLTALQTAATTAVTDPAAAVQQATDAVTSAVTQATSSNNGGSNGGSGSLPSIDDILANMSDEEIADMSIDDLERLQELLRVSGVVQDTSQLSNEDIMSLTDEDIRRMGLSKK